MKLSQVVRGVGIKASERTEKTCPKCLKTKPMGEYHKDRTKSSGHSCYCKSCYSVISHKNTVNTIGRFRERKRLEAKNRRKTYPEKIKSIVDNYREKNPEKLKAQKLLRQKVYDGEIIKPKKCSCCGDGGIIDGHHPDYNKPYDVEWLCRVCHKGRHRGFATAIESGEIISIKKEG